MAPVVFNPMDLSCHHSAVLARLSRLASHLPASAAWEQGPRDKATHQVKGEVKAGAEGHRVLD